MAIRDFLDDLTVEEISNKLNIPFFPVASVEELINTCLSNG